MSCSRSLYFLLHRPALHLSNLTQNINTKTEKNLKEQKVMEAKNIGKHQVFPFTLIYFNPTYMIFWEIKSFSNLFIVQKQSAQN